MTSSYFTIVHILVLIVIFVLSMLFLFLSFKADRKLFISLLFTNVLVSTFLAVFLMPVLDKYTKKAVLENVKHQRVLRNESIVFNGTVKNIGKFKISVCNFNVKLINQALSKNNMGGESFFKSSGASLFSWLFTENNTNNKPNTVEYSFAVVKDLDAKKSETFSVSMPYPTYFSHTTIINKISCY
ncbi:hypothetical protein LMG7974_01259 [Campylobacter majalis]|uniref:DUF2393 domain-containing protein n=1 Tax=Campylobacter majalis TaxID=2790656 RepID=A0ABM8Q850_9BACT|nr:DUF2393 family protein [Campylobacter majalis]CAD7288948.1 hypothetical protein LMG7974_01259 [Campylobacter majalis]